MRAKKAQSKKTVKNPSPKTEPKNTAQVTSLSKKRMELALKKMEPALADKFKEIRKVLFWSRAHELYAKCKIGRAILVVRNQPQKYGDKGVETLAKALGLDASTLYDYSNAANGWSEQEIVRLKKRLSVNGVPISFSHLLELSVVQDKGERKKWIDVVLEEGLSVRALHHRLQQGAPAVADEQDVQKPAAQILWARPLQALTSSAEVMLQQVQRVDEALTSLSSEELTVPNKALLERTMQVQEQLAERAAATVARIKTMLKSEGDNQHQGKLTGANATKSSPRTGATRKVSSR